MKNAKANYILTITCPDVAGLVAEVSSLLAKNGAFILEANHHNELTSGRAFLRFAFVDQTEGHSADGWRAHYQPLIARYQADLKIYDISQPMKVMIAVSKFGHCLQDLIHRWKAGILPVEICGVVSNHEDMRSFVEWAGLPFHHLPITKDTKPQQEQQIRDLFKSYDAELLILARYMQILSAEMCQDFDGKAINIHHSFLPSFKGARPYSQAHAKGVKIIGATAHYVTTNLDEGPIIEQAVERVDHSVSVEEFVTIGRETETVALTRAVRWHGERRVLLDGPRTVIFK
ncbi:formyltetrahydrofolate deformylase [Paremcibacter congregatus]|uniref:Formyltetrahydrofolate deformylase n=1 Tax=Paremcibacter congregatus TaxID=2043170 RepID=A0A2G4YQK8_9PROT|nr:formyltetrahydrofolate deformylase [Paremcibacter congregatus]PHZ84567.1 formyltetrahydrofolate deformylase [Paremcibacter congregatus]QDE28787.1 formyltetrahydrofolate deformylase [Paremcibacter congregatus]